jgi:hypothetical protein
MYASEPRFHLDSTKVTLGEESNNLYLTKIVRDVNSDFSIRYILPVLPLGRNVAGKGITPKARDH